MGGITSKLAHMRQSWLRLVRLFACAAAAKRPATSAQAAEVLRLVAAERGVVALIQALRPMTSVPDVQIADTACRLVHFGGTWFARLQSSSLVCTSDVPADEEIDEWYMSTMHAIRAISRGSGLCE